MSTIWIPSFRRIHSLSVVGVAIALLAASASAQRAVPARVTFFKTPLDCTPPKPQPDVDTLAMVYWRGVAAATSQALVNALASCGLTTNDASGRPVLDFQKDYVLVSFISAVGSTAVESGDVQPQILHFLLRPKTADYRLILPGIKPNASRVFQVVLYSPATVEFTSTLTETKLESPLATDLAAFVKQVSLTSFVIPSKFVPARRVSPGTEEPVKPTMRAQIGELPIAFGEGTMALTELAQFSPLPADMKAEVGTRIDAAVSVLTGLGHSMTSCVATMTAAAKKAVNDALANPDAKLKDVIDLALKSETCGSAAISPAQVDSVRSKFRDAVGQTTSQVSGTATIANAPLVRFRYAAIVGALIGPVRPRDQVKPNSDSKVYDADPLARAATMAAVSFYPFPYDSTSATMTLQERLSIEAGPVLTPTGGIGVGLSVGLARGLALSGGIMFVAVGKGPAEQQANDALPASGKTLMTGIGRSFYLGTKFAFP